MSTINKYTIQVPYSETVYGIELHEVEASSEEEAIRFFKEASGDFWVYSEVHDSDWYTTMDDDAEVIETKPKLTYL